MLNILHFIIWSEDPEKFSYNSLHGRKFISVFEKYCGNSKNRADQLRVSFLIKKLLTLNGEILNYLSAGLPNGGR